MSTDAVGALAVGRSAATFTVTVVDLVRPQFVPLTATWYVPGLASRGAVTRTVALVAVQPNTLDVGNAAVQPDGTLSTRKRTRSKNVELRVTLNGAFTDPPFDEIVAVEPGDIEKLPSVPIRLTLSIGSWYGSGSVFRYQLFVPR